MQTRTLGITSPKAFQPPLKVSGKNPIDNRLQMVSNNKVQLPQLTAVVSPTRAHSQMRCISKSLFQSNYRLQDHMMKNAVN